MAELSITVEARELALKERFKIAREVWDSTTNVFVFARYGDALGIGEAGPADRWGETVEGVVDEIRSVDIGKLEGPFDLEGVTELLRTASGQSDEQWWQERQSFWDDYFDVERYPTMTSLWNAGAYETAGTLADQVRGSFDYGLEKLLDGIEGGMR
mgnify:CR=1 FL=1